jgi:hypothetical protein
LKALERLLGAIGTSEWWWIRRAEGNGGELLQTKALYNQRSTICSHGSKVRKAWKEPLSCSGGGFFAI